MLLGSMPPMPIGGAEIQAIRLYKNLTALGIKVQVITWGKLWHGKNGVYSGVPFIRIKSLINVITDIPSLFKRTKRRPPEKTKIFYDDKSEITDQMTGKVWLGMILRYKLFYINCLFYLWLRRRQFDIIHVNMMEWPAIVAVKIGKTLNKQVVIKDSTMNGISNLLRYPDGVQKQLSIARQAYFVAMTKMIRQNLLKAGVPAERITDIPNGIDITPMHVKTGEWNNRVIFVGNLTQQPAKGIDILLFAWKAVTPQFPTASLEIVGDGNLEAYRNFAAENSVPNVTFAGKQSNVKERLRNADIFVLPSRREGMSNALMEAMVCAMPVVATDVSGSQDLIENNISGLLVPVGDISGLASALIKMMSDPAKAIEMGKRGYESIRSKCDMTIVAEKYKNLYTKISDTA
jgi:glycosyltransferase involved in cell wall biosynthesis